MKILIVEDEASIREVIKKYLQRAGFEVAEAASGEVALLKYNQHIDLIILDLNLPNVDGIEVCRQIKKKVNIPIIMVTARSQETDELNGLQIGAEDYIKKPFSPKVLVARVQALLRRPKEKPAAGSLIIDAEKMLVHKAGKDINLTTTQFKILLALSSRPSKVFTRSELLACSGEEKRFRQAMERTIDAHIKSIRKLIEDDPENPKYIKTVIGAGYKYNL